MSDQPKRSTSSKKSHHPDGPKKSRTKERIKTRQIRSQSEGSGAAAVESSSAPGTPKPTPSIPPSIPEGSNDTTASLSLPVPATPPLSPTSSTARRESKNTVGTPKTDRKDRAGPTTSIAEAKAAEEKEKLLTDQLSEQQVKELKEAFSIFDKNGDGGISIGELRIFLETLGQKPTDREVAALMKEVDSNGNGEIDFDEFLQMMVRLLKPEDKEEEVSKIFSVFDPKGRGYIKEDDLVAAFTTLGDDAMPFKDVREIIKATEKTPEGHIDYKSLIKLLCS